MENVFLDVPRTHLIVDSNGVTRKRGHTEDQVKEKLLKTLQILMKRQENEDAGERAAGEWRQVAQVLDRLLFWIFLSLTVTITTVLLLIIPAIHRSLEEE
ncbi:unnamed protein product [Cylicocyclus nassatus]|uniref:Neurotransmitter-gated ion-channel transmembrane domain-containing protein n=1 Tax=Cylicocyclus nassatus TaxID=53992 RepID=A0AA36GLV2_CYLNA|nr:unnamed protein product [Cylicocyclus nassatus]